VLLFSPLRFFAFQQKYLMTPRPSLIIFDVDGVLVDTRESFQRTTLETVRLFAGKRVTRTELHRWKNRPGFNDDWKLSHAWVRSLGGNFEYEEVKRKFVELYWGKNGRGNASREKWLLPGATLRRLAKMAELAIFTGRIRRELDYTLDRWKAREYFQQIVTVEDVEHPKPNPEGLLKILAGRDRARALYVGDNVDDALAARSARIPFVGVLRRQSEERRQRGTRLRKLGARAILGEISELEKWLARRPPPAGSTSTSGPPAHRTIW
jgi:HAD superfamily hydrolase (TIGR01548 family)